tara:strand:+ start:2518 stop:3024 length:507 start_codon:yes stop_codon:yes gene_type:complete
MEKAHFKLRPVNKEDAKKYVEYLRDPEVSIWLEDEVQNIKDPISVENYLLYGWYRQSIEYNGQFIGASGLDLVNKESKVARFFIVIGKKELWGKGVGSEVIKLIIKHGFENLKLRKINSDFLSPNEAVKIIHEKIGFKQEGLLRQDSKRNEKWIDRVIVSILPGEFVA